MCPCVKAELADWRHKPPLPKKTRKSMNVRSHTRPRPGESHSSEPRAGRWPSNGTASRMARRAAATANPRNQFTDCGSRPLSTRRHLPRASARTTRLASRRSPHHLATSLGRYHRSVMRSTLGMLSSRWTGSVRLLRESSGPVAADVIGYYSSYGVGAKSLRIVIRRTHRPCGRGVVSIVIGISVPDPAHDGKSSPT